MKKLKFVIIAQAITPALFPRSHRATELAKELAKQGHDVTLYALLGKYDYTDFSKNTGVKVKNLGKSKFGLIDSDTYSNANLCLKIFTKIFGKFIEFPSIELIPMVRRVIKREKKIDYLITIAVPFTIHWATSSLALKKYFKFWVSDCGDPFMGNHFIKHPFYFKYLEKKWCRMTDYITVPVQQAKDGYYEEFREKIKVIPQGFNFREVNLGNYIKNDIPTFAYSGVVYKGHRDPEKFLEYLASIESDFKFVVYTKSISMFENFKQRLGDKLEIRDYIPRDQLLFELSKMDFLVNIKNNSGVQQPSKLIDYYLTNRPIIEITSSFSEKDIFNQFLMGNYSNRMKIESLEDFKIENVANKFVELFYQNHNK